MNESHSHAHSFSATEKALLIALLLNAGFLFVEVIAGFLTNSLALLSDAGHMVSDVGALGLAVFTERLARVKPYGEYTFGLKRAPVLGAFTNGLAMLVIVTMIFYEAYQRLNAPPEISSGPVLAVGVAGLIINLASALFLFRSSEKSLNIKGALLHMLADALGSVGVIASALIIAMTGWFLVDAVVSVFIALMILVSIFPLIKDSTKILLQAAPKRIDVNELRNFLRSNEKVECLADLHIWELNSGQVVLTATFIAEDCPLEETEKLSDNFRTRLKKEFGIDHSTFEWRTGKCEDDNCEPSNPD